MPSDAAAEPPTRSSGGAIALLRSPQYRTLWVVGLAIAFSIMAQNVARAWLARELTGTNAGLGGVVFAFGVPAVVLSPLAGVVADRFSKRLVLASAELLMTAGSLVVALGLVVDSPRYWMLLVSAAMHGAAMSVFGPGLMSFTAEVIERSEVAPAVTLHYVSGEMMRVIGPAIGGVVVALGTVGQKFVFFGAAAAFLSTVFAVLRMPRSTPRPAPAASPLGDLRAGIAYVRDRRHLRLLVLTFLVVVMVAYPYTAFLPTIAGRYGVGADGFGLMTTVTGAGAVVAAFYGAWRGVRGLMARLVLGGVMFGVGVVVLSFAPSFLAALVVLPVVGAGSVLFLSTGQSLTLSLSDLDYHGRMQGILMVGLAGWGLAALPLGFLADQVGLRATLVAMGAVAVAMTVRAAIRGSTNQTLLAVRDLG